MAEEEFDFADIESVVALRNLLQKREDDGEASDAQALKEQIDVAWDGLNNFSNNPTYISISQDVTHAYFKKGWNKGCKILRRVPK